MGVSFVEIDFRPQEDWPRVVETELKGSGKKSEMWGFERICCGLFVNDDYS